MNKKIFKALLQQREIRSLIGLIIASLVIWFIAPLLGTNNFLQNTNNRLLIILILTALWGLNNLRQLKQRPAHSSSSFLTLQDNRNEGLLLESQRVQKNFQTAINFLKEKLSFSLLNNRTFYSLPWYLIIGPTQSGKTSILENSNLSFLEKERFVQLTPTGMKTTSGINWWFASSAILLDVPGSYFEQTSPASRTGWLELLRLTRNYRARQAINGVIITVDIETLMKEQKEFQEYIQTLHSRILELLRRFKHPFPAYIIISKLDKIAGFREYFDDLGDTERQQPWGITFPLHTATQKNINENFFTQEFERLLERLHQRTLWRIHQERQVTKRTLIRDFPLQLSFIKENLLQLVYEIHSQLNTTHGASLRGIYFTSAQQEEIATINQIESSVVKNLALLPAQQRYVASQYHYSFFIKNVFSNIIFPEARFANRQLKQSLLENNRWMRIITVTAMVTLLFSAIISWSHHYHQQTANLTAATEALADYKLLALTYNPHNEKVEQLLPSLNALRLANEFATQAQLPWLLRFQLHHPQTLTALTAQLYQHNLQKFFLPILQHILAQQLRNDSITDPSMLYNNLKAYLMFSYPRLADKSFIMHWFERYWQKNSNESLQLKQHLAAALQYPLPTLSFDPSLLVQVRATLNALPYPLLAYAILREDFPHTFIQPIIYTNVLHSFQLPARGIPAIFSLNQLSDVLRQINNAIKSVTDGNWILGKKSASFTEENIQILKQTLINYYLDDYSNAWQNWLGNIKVKKFNSLPEIDLALQELTSKQSPLLQLLQSVAANTDITGMRLSDNTLSQLLQKNLADKFASINQLSTNASAINSKTIIKALQNLEIEIHNINSANDISKAAFEMAKIKLQNTPDEAINQLFYIANKSPAPIKTWLESIAANAWQLILIQAKNFVVKQWKQQLFPIWEKQTTNLYPFTPSANLTISIENFNLLLKPNGLIDQFFNSYLKSFVDTKQAKWQWLDNDNARLAQDTEVLEQFERANVLQKLFFDEKGILSANLKINLINSNSKTARLQLAVDGHVIIDSRAGLYTSDIDWPHQASKTITLTLTDGQGKKHTTSATGEWALFKWIEQGKLNIHNDNQHYDLIFTLHGNNINFALTADSALNPFIPGMIDQFRSPSQNWE